MAFAGKEETRNPCVNYTIDNTVALMATLFMQGLVVGGLAREV